MATTLIGVDDATYTHGVTTSETGINVESVSMSVEPEFRDDLLDKSGHVQGQALGDEMTTYTVSGETIRSTGGAYLGTIVSGTAFTAEQTATLGNIEGFAGGDVDEFALQSVEVTKTRGAFETVNMTLISRANLTVNT